MKQGRTLIVLFLLACSHPGQLSARTGSAVLVLRLNGSAQCASGRDAFQSLRTGEMIAPGAIIQTGGEKDCFVDLLFDADPATSRDVVARAIDPAVDQAPPAPGPATDRSVVRLWSDSTLRLISASSIETGAGIVTETRLELVRGRVSGIVKKLGAASLFEVRLPGRVVAVRGGVFDISEDGAVIGATGSPINLAWSDPDTGIPMARLLGVDQRYDFRNRQITALSKVELVGLGKTANAMRFIDPSSRPLSLSQARDETKRPITPPGPPFPPPGPPPTKPPVNPPGPPSPAEK